jgi:hypothetical protein
MSQSQTQRRYSGTRRIDLLEIEIKETAFVAIQRPSDVRVSDTRAQRIEKEQLPQDELPSTYTMDHLPVPEDRSALIISIWNLNTGMFLS